MVPSRTRTHPDPFRRMQLRCCVGMALRRRVHRAVDTEMRRSTGDNSISDTDSIEWNAKAGVQNRGKFDKILIGVNGLDDVLAAVAGAMKEQGNQAEVESSKSN